MKTATKLTEEGKDDENISPPIAIIDVKGCIEVVST